MPFLLQKPNDSFSCDDAHVLKCIIGPHIYMYGSNTHQNTTKVRSSMKEVLNYCVLRKSSTIEAVLNFEGSPQL